MLNLACSIPLPRLTFSLMDVSHLLTVIVTLPGAGSTITCKQLNSVMCAQLNAIQCSALGTSPCVIVSSLTFAQPSLPAAWQSSCCFSSRTTPLDPYHLRVLRYTICDSLFNSQCPLIKCFALTLGLFPRSARNDVFLCYQRPNSRPKWELWDKVIRLRL